MLFFLARDFPMTETQRQIFQWGKGMSFFFFKKKRSGSGICLSHGQLSREQERCLRITTGGFHRLPDTSAIPAKITKARALKYATTELAV